MSQSGLQAVSNPSEIFLSEQQSDSDFLAGLAVTVIMDGSRAFLIEIQVCLHAIICFGHSQVFISLCSSRTKHCGEVSL